MKHAVVTAKDWVTAREALLAKEKEFTRARDALSAARRELPWVRIEKKYVFDGPSGEVTLADLFDGRSQLVVYHFMFAPEWEEGCKSCTFWGDQFERNVIHIEHRDASFAAISRAPLEKLLAYRKRLGWTFPWVSSGRSDFNYDFGVSFAPDQKDAVYNYRPKTFGGSDLPGISVFAKDESGAVFHTYSTYGRGIEMVNAAYHVMDLLPKGRDEETVGNMGWLRRRDAYDDRA